MGDVTFQDMLAFINSMQGLKGSMPTPDASQPSSEGTSQGAGATKPGLLTTLFSSQDFMKMFLGTMFGGTFKPSATVGNPATPTARVGLSAPMPSFTPGPNGNGPMATYNAGMNSMPGVGTPAQYQAQP